MMVDRIKRGGTGTGSSHLGQLPRPRTPPTDGDQGDDDDDGDGTGQATTSITTTTTRTGQSAAPINGDTQDSTPRRVTTTTRTRTRTNTITGSIHRTASRFPLPPRGSGPSNRESALDGNCVCPDGGMGRLPSATGWEITRSR